MLSKATDRRAWLKRTAALLLAASATRVLHRAAAAAQPPGPDAPTLLDRLWIFTCAANSDFPHIGRRSVMTPVEGAFYLGVPNIIVVQSSEKEAPYGRLEPPLVQYAVPMRRLKRVVWSVVGSGGFYSASETREVLELAKTMPNFVGIMLDDFFTGQKEGKRARLTVEELAQIRAQLKRIRPNLEVFVTLYDRQLNLPVADYLELIDVVTLWTGRPEGLANLEANLQKAERLAPKARRMLGCYLVDYGRKQGMPLAAMQLQCQTGLRWLQQGRIEGIIFLGNTTMDLGFESVEWTRQWIEKVGSMRLAAAAQLW